MMKTNTARNVKGLFFLLSIAVAAGCAGCSRRETKVEEVAKTLEQSFTTAPSEAQQGVALVAKALQIAANEPDITLRQSQYMGALASMRRVVERSKLSAEQIQAVRKMFAEVATAVQNEPRLNSKELYDAQNALALALHAAGGGL